LKKPDKPVQQIFSPTVLSILFHQTEGEEKGSQNVGALNLDLAFS
jgi:hypothetical protein